MEGCTGEGSSYTDGDHDPAGPDYTDHQRDILSQDGKGLDANYSELISNAGNENGNQSYFQNTGVKAFKLLEGIQALGPMS